jgi:hypothetical protein
MPNRIWEVVEQLTTCLCAQLLTDGLPPVCVCGTLPGVEVALLYAGDCDDACGQAWVRLAGAYPSVTIGQPSTRPGNCGSGIGIDLELGVARCVDVGDADEPPPPQALVDAARLQMDDMLAMWRAVACCRASKDWIVGAYTPFGPEGGLVGGTLLVQVLVT